MKAAGITPAAFLFAHPRADKTPPLALRLFAVIYPLLEFGNPVRRPTAVTVRNSSSLGSPGCTVSRTSRTAARDASRCTRQRSASRSGKFSVYGNSKGGPASVCPGGSSFGSCTSLPAIFLSRRISLNVQISNRPRSVRSPFRSSVVTYKSDRLRRMKCERKAKSRR